MRETAEAINHQAVAWVAQMDRAPLGADDQARLDHWLALDERHQGALLRAQAAWSQLDRAGVLDVADTAPALIKRSGFMAWRRVGLASIAASCAAVVVAFGLSQITAGQSIQTQRGEIRRVPLEDGSLMAVNTDTAVRFADSGASRRLRLEQGEAWVHVAKDAARPFIVSVGNVRVQAIGTAFSVRRVEGAAEVMVTEGVVEVWNTASPETRMRLSQGHGAVVGQEAGPTPIVSDVIHRKLSWRDGEIVLEGETLAAAVAEFNRYNRQQIVIEDAALNDTALVGRFRTNEPEAFARAVAVTAPARAVVGPDVIRLSSRSPAG